MKKAILILLVVLIGQRLYSQVAFSEHLTLKIESDTLFFCDSALDTVSTSIEIYNFSDENIIVYGLMGDGVDAAPFDLSKFCDKKDTGTSIAFAIYRPDGRQFLFSIKFTHGPNSKRVTKSVLDSVLNRNRIRFLQSEKTLVKYEKWRTKRIISLEDFRLPKGMYYLQMMYYSGEKTLSYLDLNGILKSGNKLFQGCVMSQKVPLVVR